MRLASASETIGARSRHNLWVSTFRGSPTSDVGLIAFGLGDPRELSQQSQALLASHWLLQNLPASALTEALEALAELYRFHTEPPPPPPPPRIIRTYTAPIVGRTVSPVFVATED